ncbi:MAG TPA: hypothetical protein PLQ13_04340 [Candidatus Krumholzibacteria bacterium]|nr:hypothetical protein [Candidatus Krumholzibacteria bacterium]
MKKLLLVLAALSLFATAAYAQYSEVGIYTSPDGNPANTSYNGAAGPLTLYAVVMNPRNLHTGSPDSNVESAIQTLGGFEFKLILPSNGTVFMTGQTYPAGTTNFLSPPNFLAGCNIPVVNGAAVCVTLNLYAVAQIPAGIFLSPVDQVPSIPGSLAITDFADDFRLNPAFPASGSFADPVFGLWTNVVDAQDASWGQVKSLFR